MSKLIFPPFFFHSMPTTPVKSDIGHYTPINIGCVTEVYYQLGFVQ